MSQACDYPGCSERSGLKSIYLIGRGDFAFCAIPLLGSLVSITAMCVGPDVHLCKQHRPWEKTKQGAATEQAQ